MRISKLEIQCQKYERGNKVKKNELTHIFCQVCNRTAELPHKCPDGTEWVKVSKRGVGL